MFPRVSVTEVVVPEDFIGKTIDSLKIWNRYNIEILLIERESNPFAEKHNETMKITPDKLVEFALHDRLIIYGQTENVSKFKNYATSH